jgi:hypothetical protein
VQHFERSYATARTVFAITEFAGWCIVVIGAIASLVGFSTGGLMGMGFGEPPFAIRLLSMIPGLGMALAGLVSVAFVQSSRANVDSAEMSREMLALMRNSNVPSKIVPPPVAKMAPPPVTQSKPNIKSDNIVGLIKEYGGYNLVRVSEGIQADNKIFETAAQAEQYIDSL